MIGRLRLVDAVAAAAVAMLALKLLDLAAGPGTPETAPKSGVVAPGQQLPAFGRAIAYARTNYVPPDVTMTASMAAKKEEKKEAPPPEPPAPKPPAFEPVPLPASKSERELLERLGERRDELQQRDKTLDMREKLLEGAEKKLDARIGELKSLETKAKDQSAKQDDDGSSAMRSLVVMYEAMKPKDAARVFDRLALDVLVPVVVQIKPAKMAEILAAMSPDAAEKLTVALANRARGKTVDARAPAAGALPSNELPAIDAPMSRPPS